MYLSFGLYVFATALVLVQGLTHHVIHDEEPPEVVRRLAQCGAKAIRRELRWNEGNVTANPYKMLVALKTEPGYKYDPSMVWVPRCSGFCMNGMVSMPTSSDMKEFTVKRSNSAGETECVRINVQTHTKCKCMCPSDGSMCSDKHEWNPKTCACDCKHSHIVKREEDKCRKNPENMVWNNEECACECRERIMGCMTGESWNENECLCVKRK